MNTKMKNNAIHLEPTSRCTLGCSNCIRTQYIDSIPIEDCDIDMVIKATKEKNWLHMCGNHGDPIYHPKFHELLHGVRKENPTIVFSMHTNGAFRSIDWWEKTASLLTNKKDTIYFSIDGLPNNNHIYRVNSKWESIENGIRTLARVNPNLKLIWKWIVFKYNQNQIDEGIELAKKLGFSEFEMVNSFDNPNDLDNTLDWQMLKEKYT